MQIVSGILGGISFIVGILVLVKLFQKEGVLKGILGLICMLYTFIWGWMHAKEDNFTNLMIIWTAVIVISAIVSGIIAATATPAEGASMLLFII